MPDIPVYSYEDLRKKSRWRPTIFRKYREQTVNKAIELKVVWVIEYQE